MADGTSAAVTETSRLPEIQFPEFTAKLVTDTFDALIAANLRQTQSYIELVQQVSKSLSIYINDTKDDIGGDQILQFLAAAVPIEGTAPAAVSGSAGTSTGTGNVEATPLPTKVVVGQTLTDGEATTLNEALKITDPSLVKDQQNKLEADNTVSGLKGGKLDDAAVKSIMEAAARRIAASKYTILKEMVKMGLLRIVVENGVVETKLTFNTWGSSSNERHSSSYNSSNFSVRAQANTGWLVSKWVDVAAKTSYTNLSVRTAREDQQDRSGSSVQIFGRVEIHFKTDYQPLLNA